MSIPLLDKELWEDYADDEQEEDGGAGMSRRGDMSELCASRPRKAVAAAT